MLSKCALVGSASPNPKCSVLCVVEVLVFGATIGGPFALTTMPRFVVLTVTLANLSMGWVGGACQVTSARSSLKKRGESLGGHEFRI